LPDGRHRLPDAHPEERWIWLKGLIVTILWALGAVQIVGPAYG
jgi:hypothetical protein